MDNKFLLVLGVVFLLGCTGGAAGYSAFTTVGSYGLIVSEFSTEFTEIDEGDQLTLTVEVQNIDQQTAENIGVQLFTSGLKVDGSDIQSLPDLESNDTDFVEFLVEAPAGYRIDRTYNPYVQLCYNYASVASSGVFVIEENILTRDTEVPLITSDESVGPLEAVIDFGSQDFISVKSGESKKRIVRIDLLNRDVGRVVNGTGVGDYTVMGNESEVVELDTIRRGGVMVVFPATQFAEGNVSDPRKEFKCVNTSEEKPSEDSILKDGVSSGVVFNKTNSVYCVNDKPLKFSSASGLKRISFNVDFNIKKNQKDIVTAIVSLDYRYCLTTDQLEIVAYKIG